MLSISRSRYSLPVQSVFLAVNAVGIFLVTIYNASTPDLYPDNAHHKLGWIMTWVLSAQIVMGVISAYTRRKEGGHQGERAAFVPVSTEAMAEHDLRHAETYRFSNDSGQGTEPNTESLRSQSISSHGSEDSQLPDVHQRHEEEDMEVEKQVLMRGSKVDQYLSKKLPGLLSSRALRVFQILYDVVDRLILIFGFAGLATGFVTYGGLFVRDCLPTNHMSTDAN